MKLVVYVAWEITYLRGMQDLEWACQRDGGIPHDSVAWAILVFNLLDFNRTGSRLFLGGAVVVFALVFGFNVWPFPWTSGMLFEGSISANWELLVCVVPKSRLNVSYFFITAVVRLCLAKALDLTCCVGHRWDAGMGFPNSWSFLAAIAVASHVPMVAWAGHERWPDKKNPLRD